MRPDVWSGGATEGWHQRALFRLGEPNDFPWLSDLGSSTSITPLLTIIQTFFRITRSQADLNIIIILQEDEVG